MRSRISVLGKIGHPPIGLIEPQRHHLHLACGQAQTELSDLTLSIPDAGHCTAEHLTTRHLTLQAPAELTLNAPEIRIGPGTQIARGAILHITHTTQADRPQTDSGLYYLHTDHLGPPRSVTDEQQRVIWRWTSDPFGNGLPDEDPDGDDRPFQLNLRFPGQYYDEESGLHYNYYRYYDPGTGRYITSDPIGLQGGLNTYAYAGGNPTRFTDPQGLLPTFPWPSPSLPLPDYGACEYYDRKCNETGCRYYCTTAPGICRNAERLPLFWGIDTANLNCIRRCLVREDAKTREERNQSQCSDDPCLSDKEIDDYHDRCFTECGVPPWRYPGVNPPWVPWNPNKPN